MFLFSKQHIGDLSDSELISRYQKKGDKKYLGPLFERYSHLVFGVCMKYLKNEDESKDAVLNIFEKLMKDLQFKEVNSFKSWIYVVAKNHCLMHIRSSATFDKKLDDYKAFESNEHSESFDNLETKLEHLEQAIEELKEEQKECIKLFFLQNKCYNEVAEITGYSLLKVKSYIQNGKRNLKIKLVENYGSIFTT